MSGQPGAKGTVERYMEQMLGLAVEAGQMLDKTMDVMETSSKEFVRAVERETRDNTQEIKRMANEIVGEAKQDLPKLRAELREMEARAREKLRDLRGH